MTSSRPYLIRAIHEWIADNGWTPHLLVNVERPGVDAPLEYADQGRIVLNVSPLAVQGLSMGNDRIGFSARFGGAPRGVSLPIDAVIAIYARENGQGMFFGEGEDGEEATIDAGQSESQDGEQEGDGGDGSTPGTLGGGKPHLRVVK